MTRILKACAALLGGLGLLMSFGGCQFDPFDPDGGIIAWALLLAVAGAIANVLTSFGNILGGG